MKKLLCIFTVVVLAFSVLCLSGCDLDIGFESESSGSNNPSSSSSSEYIEYHFKNQDRLYEHYKKHGIEMGFASAQEYEQAASDVINNRNALNKTEAEDGDYVYYIESTNEFVILSTEGFIRTYFLPSSGKKYYDRQ